MTADAAGTGAADGLGSIILNGLRYDTDSATQVQSAAALRGAVLGSDVQAGRFVVMARFRRRSIRRRQRRRPEGGRLR